MTTPHEPADGLSGLSELMSADHDATDRPGRPPIDPVRRRRRRIRGLSITAIVLVGVLGTTGGYVAWALNAPLPAPVATSQAPSVSVPPPTALALPGYGATAISVSGGDAFLGEAASGIWATSGDAEPRPIASITKLVTALVILDARPLASADDAGPTLTFDEADHDLYDEYYVRGATIAAMPAGSSMSLRDALATMLIPSASNYADAVSTWAFGSRGGFAGAARRWLADNGLTSTTIVEPTGLDPRNTSTPADLIALGKIAAAHPAIADIVATQWVDLPATGRILNTNTLLGTSGVTGLKTGNLGENSSNLLFTASVDVGIGAPLSVVGVVVGGPSKASVNRDVVALLDSIRAGFHPVPLATSGQEVGSFVTPWGASARMVIDEDASILTWSDTPIAVTMDTTTPVTYEDGEQIGTVTWTAGPHTETAAVVIEGSIEPPTEWWRLTHPEELGAD